MLLAHKVELRPSKGQQEKLFQWVGTTRHCFNHLLGNFSKEGVKFAKKSAREYLYNTLRVENAWYSEVSQAILQESINDLESGYKRFFKKQGGYPKFKKRNSKNSFSIREKNEDLKLGESSWECRGCGQQVDRDLNASKNILEEGLRQKPKK